MDKEIKKSVMDWIDRKIYAGYTEFDILSCIKDIGLDPFNQKDYNCVEDVFEWHKSLINHIYDVCMEENT
jgi:hypothetical protein